MHPHATAAPAHDARAVRAALDALDRRWGESYDLAITPDGRWLARRLDDGATLTAATPGELGGLLAVGAAARDPRRM
jgi:hypothetical protein